MSVDRKMELTLGFRARYSAIQTATNRDGLKTLCYSNELQTIDKAHIDISGSKHINHRNPNVNFGGVDLGVAPEKIG